jgi:hypothetical protein
VNDCILTRRKQENPINMDLVVEKARFRESVRFLWKPAALSLQQVLFTKLIPSDSKDLNLSLLGYRPIKAYQP